MALSAKKISVRPAQPRARGIPGGNYRPDAIEREFLELWLGISRLREQVLGDCDCKPDRARIRTVEPPASRKSRGQAA